MPLSCQLVFLYNEVREGNKTKTKLEKTNYRFTPFGRWQAEKCLQTPSGRLWRTLWRICQSGTLKSSVTNFWTAETSRESDGTGWRVKTTWMSLTSWSALLPSQKLSRWPWRHWGRSTATRTQMLSVRFLYIVQYTQYIICSIWIMLLCWQQSDVIMYSTQHEGAANTNPSWLNKRTCKNTLLIILLSFLIFKMTDYWNRGWAWSIRFKAHLHNNIGFIHFIFAHKIYDDEDIPLSHLSVVIQPAAG